MSLVLGGLLTALLPALLSPAAFIWMCFFIAGLTMYVACKPFVAKVDRTRTAVLYMLGPYLVMTALVRFAAAELLVQALLPLVALWLYRAIWERDQADGWRAALKLGCLLGLCWITDVPASIALLYGLLPVAALCAWRQRRGAALARFLAAEAMAGALAAFYLAPAWVEQRWISMQGLLDDDPRLMLMFVRLHGAPQPNYVLGAWLFAAAGTAMVAVCVWRRGLGNHAATRTWVYMAGVSLLLQLPVSGLLWRYVPEMRAVQFPYRFLPLIWLAVPLVVFAKGMRRNLRWPVCAMTAALSCFPVFAYARAQRSARMRTPPLASMEAQWARDGYMGKPEYVQPGVSRPAVPLHAAAAMAVEEGPQAHCEVALQGSELTSRVLLTDAQGACEARLGTYYFPYWRATDETGQALPVGKDARGLLLVELPPRHHTVRVWFQPASTVRSVSAGVSGVSLLCVGCGLVWFRRRTGKAEARAGAAARPATL